MGTGDIQDLMKIKICAIFLQFHFDFCPNFANNLLLVLTKCARILALNYTWEVLQLETA